MCRGNTVSQGQRQQSLTDYYYKSFMALAAAVLQSCHQPFLPQCGQGPRTALCQDAAVRAVIGCPQCRQWPRCLTVGSWSCGPASSSKRPCSLLVIPPPSEHTRRSSVSGIVRTAFSASKGHSLNRWAATLSNRPLKTSSLTVELLKRSLSNSGILFGSSAGWPSEQATKRSRLMALRRRNCGLHNRSSGEWT